MWRDAASKSPNNGRALRGLGTAYFNLGMNDLALDVLQRAAILEPSDVDSHLNLGSALQKAGKFYEASKEFIKALEVLPSEGRLPGDLFFNRSSWKIHNNLGNAFREMSMVDDAIDQHLQAQNFNPTSGVIHFNLGMDYKKKGDIQRAREEFLTAVRLDPDFKDAAQALEDLSPRDDVGGGS